MFKKPVDATTNGLYPPVTPDPTFRKQVFEAERTHYVPRHKDEITTKLGELENPTNTNILITYFFPKQQTTTINRMEGT